VICYADDTAKLGDQQCCPKASTLVGGNCIRSLSGLRILSSSRSQLVARADPKNLGMKSIGDTLPGLFRITACAIAASRRPPESRMVE
jgi:hypothetical protein